MNCVADELFTCDPALRFQPIRRPQANQKKPTKPGFPKAIPATVPSAQSPGTTAVESRGATPPDAAAASNNNSSNSNSNPAAAAAAPGPRSTLADWAAAGGDDDDAYGWGAAAGEKRQRGGRKVAKKRKKQQQEQRHQQGGQTDWNEIYDPARPTNVDEYLRSDERVREVQEWKAVLYAHRRARARAAGRGSRSRSRSRSGTGSERDSDEESEGEERVGAGGSKSRDVPPEAYYRLRCACAVVLATFANGACCPRPVCPSGKLLLRTTTHVPLCASSGLTCRRRRRRLYNAGPCARRRNRRRCLCPSPRPLRDGGTTACTEPHASTTAAPSYSCSSSSSACRGRRNHLPRTGPLRSTTTTTTTARRRHGH